MLRFRQQAHYYVLPSISLLCPTITPVLHQACFAPRLLHQACYAQAPTEAPSYMKLVMLKPRHTPPSYLLWPGPNMFPPTSCLLCSGPYIITQVLHQACHAQVPTANRLYLCPNICFYPPSYMMLVMLNPLRTSSRFLHQACYAQAPTYVALLLEACYAQAPTSAP